MCPTTVKPSFTGCGDPKDHSKQKIWLMMVFKKKKIQGLQTSTVDSSKAFFHSHLTSKFGFSEKKQENREFFFSPPLKNNCDVMWPHNALFWKACISSFKFDTHHLAVRCLRRKLRPHFRRKFFKKSSNSYHFTPISTVAIWQSEW